MLRLKCGKCRLCGACCKYHFLKTSAGDDEIKFYALHEDTLIKPGDEPDTIFIAFPFHCAMLKDNKCILHGKPEQPYLCKVYPSNPERGYWKAVNTFAKCGYFFIELNDFECPSPLA